jgi:4-carboxymuconolactone decarboxylase
MARLPEIRRDKLSAAQEALLNAIGQSPRGVGMAFEGPFGVWMHSPEIGNTAQQLGQKLRYGSALPARLSELAILVCASHWRASYEWHVHAPIARAAGLGDIVIDAIATGHTPVFSAADEAVIHRCATSLLATSRLDEADYRAAVDQLGEQGTVDLVALLGYYTLVAFTLNAFEVNAPATSHAQRAIGP